MRLLCTVIYWVQLAQISGCWKCLHSFRKKPQNKQNLIATYSKLKEWNRFAADMVLIIIEMNMMTDNEYMLLDALLPNENERLWKCRRRGEENIMKGGDRKQHLIPWSCKTLAYGEKKQTEWRSVLDRNRECPGKREVNSTQHTDLSVHVMYTRWWQTEPQGLEIL